MRDRILERLPLFVGLTFVALAFGLGAVAISDGIRDRGRNDTISVTGSAKRAIVSNYIVWDASISSQQAIPGKALVQLNNWTDRVRKYLRSSGVTEAELTVAPIATETVRQTDANGDETGKVLGYRLTRTFEVRSSRVGAIASLAENSAGLLKSGVPLEAQPPQYVYTKLPSLRPQLLAEATQDALNRARVLVGSTGGRLGGLREVNVGVFQVTAPNSTEVSDYGVYDTTTLKKDVTAVVNVTFALG